MSLRVSSHRLAELSAFVGQRLGLHFPEARAADLERGMIAACKELGFGELESCIGWLLSAPLSQTQIETLAGHLTIGETYLLREGKTFEALEQKVLPDIIRARRSGERRLRLWSAGCSSGEEAYSLAITVTRILPDLKDWHVTILGTDINPVALRKAAEGVYSEWSFRMTPAWVKERYFEPAGAKHFRILPSIRRMVRFQYLNLAEDVFPALLNDTNAMDVIFCRNVLLYFSPERAARVVARFRLALVEDGWLIGGLAEQFQASEFVRVPFEGTTLFQKTIPVSAVVRRALPPAPAVLAAPPRPRAAAPAPPPTLPPPTSPVRTLAGLARASANAGRLSEALRHCDEAIALEKMNAAHHYLRATILAEQEQPAEAEHAFRRALYLDPHLVLAHFALATLTRRQGRERECLRHLDNAFSLLGEYDQGEILPESDGITAGRLAEIIKATTSAHPS